VPDFRYPQFCAVARAAELVGERWTILVLRELFFGQQRFGDLRRRLSDVSPSVLSERLTSLEAAGIIEKTELPPPAASTVYQLTERGHAFRPVLAELGRWGTRFLLPPRPGEELHPDRLAIVLSMYARKDPTPELRCELRLIEGGDDDPPDLATRPSVTITVEGGQGGTRVTDSTAEADTAEPVHLSVTGPAVDIISVLAGITDPDEATAAGRIRIEGDAARLALIPRLFDLASEESAPGSQRPGPSATQGE
jgi:DNA-binding HxlR family transcriptional regulator